MKNFCIYNHNLSSPRKNNMSFSFCNIKNNTILRHTLFIRNCILIVSCRIYINQPTVFWFMLLKSIFVDFSNLNMGIWTVNSGRSRDRANLTELPTYYLANFPQTLSNLFFECQNIGKHLGHEKMWKYLFKHEEIVKFSFNAVAKLKKVSQDSQYLILNPTFTFFLTIIFE